MKDALTDAYIARQINAAALMKQKIQTQYAAFSFDKV